MKIPTIKPEWRTSTVIELCQSMREAQEFSALPILADALQDADCDNDEFLLCLRTETPSPIESQRVVAVVMSAEGAESVRWLEEFASDLPSKGAYDLEEDSPEPPPMSYEQLMQAANGYAMFGERTTEHGGQDWQEALYHNKKEVWKHYQIATGQRVDDDEANFFACSC